MNLPKLPLRFLEWFCPDDLLEGILGDLEEKFAEDVSNRSMRKARWHFRWNVIRLFHPSILFRNPMRLSPGPAEMVVRHIQTTSRQMWRNPFYSIVTLAGLSVTTAFVFLTLLFIRKEQSFDQFHLNKNRIFRVYQEIKNAETGTVIRKSAVTPVPLAEGLANSFSGIQNYTRLASSTATVYQEAEPFTETVHFADAAFLDMFDFPLLQGNLANALTDPLDLVLSPDIAVKYFGQGNPLGQELRLTLNDTTITTIVRAVLDPRKAESSIPFDFILPIDQYQQIVSKDLFDSYAYGLLENYIQLATGIEPKDFGKRLRTTRILEQDENSNQQVLYGLQPLSQIHLADEVTGNALYTSPQKLYFLMILAILVITIAGMNFIILSTSQALGRFREIGVRKTLGAQGFQLWWQLMVESSFICILAASLGVFLAWWLTPLFGQLTGSPLTFQPGWGAFGILLLVMLLVALTTSLLEARIILRTRVQDALSGKNKNGKTRNTLNDGFVVLQFALSIALVLGALTIRRQMQYILHKDLGFDKERLLEIALPATSSTDNNLHLVKRFAALVQKNKQVLAVSASMNNSSEPWTELIFAQSDGEKEKIFYNQIDANYLSTMGIELVDGRNFTPDGNNASSAILVNETLVRHFHWDNPINKEIPGKNFTGSHRIIGVVKDFHFSSLHQQIAPLILSLDLEPVASGISGVSTHVWPANLYQILVRIGPGDLEPILNNLESTWRSMVPDQAFSYQFVDDALKNKYAEEARWEKAMDWASLFAVGIAWLGLLSLMRLSVRKKTREIGIRKVLGSSIPAVVTLLTRKFFWLVLIGSLVAWPVAWLLLGKWLNTFSYRIELSPWSFVLVGLAVLIFTTGTIGFQSWQASRANPVDSLKQE